MYWTIIEESEFRNRKEDFAFLIFPISGVLLGNKVTRTNSKCGSHINCNLLISDCFYLGNLGLGDAPKELYTFEKAMKKFEETYPNTYPYNSDTANFQSHNPAIECLDEYLGRLANCVRVSLSFNRVPAIKHLNYLSKLKVLDLSNNILTSTAGIESVKDTLEQLTLCRNEISNLAGVASLKKLKYLFISYNKIAEWNHLAPLSDLKNLEMLTLEGNPLCDSYTRPQFKLEVAQKWANIKKLDGEYLMGCRNKGFDYQGNGAIDNGLQNTADSRVISLRPNGVRCIEELSESLSALMICETLLLPQNAINQISSLGFLKNLKKLDLSENLIVSLSGLEVLGDNLQMLNVSLNMIKTLEGVEALRNLTTLLVQDNCINDWSELCRLQKLEKLEVLTFFGNPLHRECEQGIYKKIIAAHLRELKYLDGELMLIVV